MSKIGKIVPPGIKRPIVKFLNWCGRCKGKVYIAASHGRIWWPDKAFQKWDYNVFTRKKLDFNNPVLFNEKLQWLKYYYRNPEFTRYVDKYAVRDYIAQTLGEEYLNEMYGIYDSFDEIDFSALPNQFVLKCTHDSGSIVICRDKSNFDIEKAKSVINNALSINHFYKSREWIYKNVKPRIICEKYIRDDRTNDLPDYRYFCFGGEVKFVGITTGRHLSGIKTDYFWINGDVMDMEEDHYPRTGKTFEEMKPINYDKMVEFAGILSKNKPFVRIDFYEVNGKLIFGEMTFYHSGGRLILTEKSEKYQKILGDMIDLSKVNKMTGASNAKSK